MTEIDKAYSEFLTELKNKIATSRYKAARAVNAELILLYWEIGHSILKKLSSEAWGTKIIDQLAKDLNKNFPDMKGFSLRNLKYMRQFAQEWPIKPIRQQAVAQLPWGHNLVLLQKIHNSSDRLWYAQKAGENGWSRNVLIIQIESNLRSRIGSDQKTHNFEVTLKKDQSDLANKRIKSLEN